MKTWKKIASLLCAFVLGASLTMAPAAAYADITYDEEVARTLQVVGYVADQDNLLSQSEITSLNAMGHDVLADYSVGAYYATVKSLEGYSEAEDYASDYIDAYNLDGLSAGGCVLLLVCLPENQFAIVSAGSASKTFPADTLSHLTNEINPYLGRSDWLGAGETFFDDVRQTLSGTQANTTSEVAYNGTYVVDNYGLFSDDQRAALEAQATSLAQQYDMGVYLLVVDYMQDSSGSKLANPSSSQRTNFATSFYRANDLGLGAGNDGIMLAIAVDSRDYVTIAYGQGSYSFSDEGIETMENRVTSYLGDNDWYKGCDAYYDSIGEQLQYYAVRGEPYTEPDIFSLLLKVLATLGIPVGVASARVGREKAAMKTAREASEASNYLVRDSFALTRSSDKFIRTSLVTAPIPKHESSDSGGGFGGGGWGGGGGGGFSSSGGGKF